MERIRAVAIFSVVLHLSFSISVIERRAFKTCVKDRRREDGILTKNATRFCRLFAREEAHAKATFGSSEAQKLAARNLGFEYFQNLAMWKNGQKSIESTLLNMVAPCWRASAGVKSKWESVYSRRQDHEVHLLEVRSQTWRDDEGLATINPFTSGMSADSLEAAEILLQRHKPSDIGETYGRYRTLAYIKQNKTWEKIHSDYQPSCAYSRGDVIVMELNVASLMEALARRVRDPLNFRVRVQPRRQYFSDSTGEAERVPVVKQVVGLVLHFRHSEDAVPSYLLDALRDSGVGSGLTLQDPLLQRMGNAAVADGVSSALQPRREARQNDVPSGSRQKRGIPGNRNTRPPPLDTSQRTMSCRRRPYRMTRVLYDRLNISFPEYENDLLDMGECLGTCTAPFAATNATDHAVIIAMDMSRNPDLTVCCIPQSYDFVNFVVFRKYWQMNKWKDFKAKSCACR